MAFEVVCDITNETDWLAARCLGIGASEMPILLGASDWGSNLELYYRKTGEAEEPVREQTEDMLWGKLLERQILEETCRRAGVELVPGPQRLLRSLAHPWALSTPDGMTLGGEPAEVKNLSHGYDAEAWTEQIPEKYLIQCHQQMLVAGSKRCLFGSLLWGSKLIWEWVPRDEMLIRRIANAGSEFWGHVERREPPPSDGHPHARKVLGKLATEEAAVELYDSEIGQKLSLFERAQAAHAKADAVAKKAKREFDAAKDQLAQEMGQHREAFTAGGWRMRWKKTERRGFTVAATTIQQFEVCEPKG